MSERGALAGLRVLDLTDERGVYCTKILASLGADVLRVESPAGDPVRGLGPFLDPDHPSPDQSLFAWFYNLNKRAVRLDLGTPSGRERLAELAADADVLVETFPPGHLAGLGLGHEHLGRRNPRLIVASLTGFGQSGPHSDYRAPDLVGWAMSGVMNLTGEPDRPPLRAAWNQANQIAALFTLIGILAAIHERRASDRGQAIDISIQEAVASTAESTPLFWTYLGQLVRRSGSSHPLAAPFRVDRSADGWVLIPAVSRAQWEALVGWMAKDGVTGHLSDEKYLDIFNRIQDRAYIEGTIREWVKRHDSDSVFRIGQSYALATAPINTPAGAAENEQLRFRNYFIEVEHPELDRAITYPGAPFRLAAGSRTTHQRAPLAAEVPEAADWLADDGGRTPKAVGSGRPHPNPLPAGEGTGPLAGIRVLDFSWLVAGPTAAKILAQLGADVIKVEAREVGDPARALPPFPADRPRTVNAGGLFNLLNTSKRGVTVNVKHPEGVAVLRRLAERSDIVIDNFSAGTMDRLGLGYDVLRQLNPGIIQVGMSGFGRDGPYRDYVSFHPTLTALCGLTYLTSFPDSQPLGFGNSFMDYLGGIHAAAATLAALEQRAQTGEGQFIDSAQFEAGAALVGPAILEYLATGRDPVPLGNARPERADVPHNVYPCAGDDRWIAIAVTNDAEWAALCRVLGDPEWAGDERLAQGEGRAARTAEIDRQIAEWTARFDAQDLMRRLQAAGVPAGVVQNGQDLLESDEHLRERDFYRLLDHPEIGQALVDRSPLRFSRTPVPERRRAPLLTEHTEEVLRDVLGLEQEKIDDLLINEVI